MTEIDRMPKRCFRTPQRRTDQQPLEAGFSIIVPVYNEENAIENTLDLIRGTLPKDACYELIVVDDGSTDRSPEVLQKYADAHPGAIRALAHPVNQGYGAALKTGIRAVQTELIVITDADGTYPIDRISELRQVLLHDDVAMVIGARVGEGVEYSKLRKVPKVFLKAYIEWIAGTKVPDFNSGLRAFRKDVAERFLGILPDGFSFTTTITLACLTNKLPVAFVPISYRKRVGDSKIRPIRDTIRFMQLILRTGMYFAPLRVVGPFAFLLFFGGLVSFGFDVANRNITDSTVLLFLFSFNTGVFALLADMIDKRLKK